MDIVRVPAAASHQPQINTGEIIFMDYSDRGSYFRNRVLFDCYAFSFVQNGCKQIYRAGGMTLLTKGQGMLIPEGHALIAEHNDNDAAYQSVIVFFPGAFGRDFLADRLHHHVPPAVREPYVHFLTNPYLEEYVRHLRALIAGRQSLSLALARLKLYELLTAVYEIAPETLCSVFAPVAARPLRHLIEQHLLEPLTLEELAFLANRSLSSFKRDFRQAYGLSPQRYIRDRRLEMAANELKRGRLASEIYLDYGYQHLANFTTAFKRKFGITPGDYGQPA